MKTKDYKRKKRKKLHTRICIEQNKQKQKHTALKSTIRGGM